MVGAGRWQGDPQALSSSRFTARAGVVKAVSVRPPKERSRQSAGAPPAHPPEQELARVASARALSVRSVQRLQASAGNAAVSLLLTRHGGHGGTGDPGVGTTVQRLASGGGCPAPPAAPPAVAPGQDPRFRAVKADVAAKKKTIGHHPPATSESKAAQDAAVAPPDDKLAQGKAAQAEKMNAAKPGGFDKAAFIRAVYAAVAAKTPKNLDEADKFADSGKAGEIKSEVAGQVGKGKETSARDIATTTKAAPDTSGAKEKQVTPLKPAQPPPRPAAPNAANAIPPKAPPSATEFGAGKCETGQQMADAEVTEEQLRKGNEPQFDQALTAKKAGEAHDAKAPAQARANEQRQLEAAKADAAQAGQAGIVQMVGARVQAGQQVTAGKGQAKSKDEAKRAEVTARLQKVFDAAKADVEKTLSGLDGLVDERFNKGEQGARAAFTADHERRMEEYKDQRYSGLTGKLRWVKDKFAGLPAEANQIYQHSKRLYEQKMQAVISDIADLVGSELGKAKDRIARGRAELKAEVAKLPKDLQRFGQEAAKDFAGKFDELDKSVDEKSQQLVEHLAERYVEARNAVDEEIKRLQEANKGLWDKVKEAVAGAIQTILQLKDLLMGVLRKAASVVMTIIKDPIGFLGKLVSGVKSGLAAFISNIGEHLKKGLVGWLLGSLGGAGIELPGRFDLKGVIQMVASLLGLTWARIRGRVVQRGVPEQAMSAVEQSVPVAQTLQNEGVPGLWQQIVGKIGDVKELVLGKVKDYLIPTVLVAGITWIVSLLNPASAFIKAVKAIIDIVQFIFERGAQLIEFVNAVLDAIIAIAGGAVGGAAKLIETALAKSIPVLIGFLAALLGIGGLATKVKAFFQSLTKPVMSVVDTVVGWIVKVGKKLWAKLKGRFGKKGNQAAVQPAGFQTIEVPFAMHGAGHWILIKGPGLVVMASREQVLLDKVTRVLNQYKAEMERRPGKASVRSEVARIKLLERIRHHAHEVLNQSNGIRAGRGGERQEAVLRTGSRRLTALLAEYSDRYDARDLAFDPGWPTFAGSEQVRTTLARFITAEGTVKDAMWNLAAPGNADVVRFITSGQFDNCRNIGRSLSQLASASMLDSVRMAFQNAAKLLNRGARVVFEPSADDETGVPGDADIDLATIRAGRVVDVYQFKRISVGNLKSQLRSSASQLRGVTEARRRIAVIQMHDISRADLDLKPERREAREEIAWTRRRNATVSFRIRCANEG
ncbi:MAG: phage tail protein [Egibacteraceae bacterium]